MIDGQPYRQVGEVAPARIVLVADHASNFVPDDVELGIDPVLMDTHIAVDIGVEGVADRLARRHSMPAHIACVSRLVCDLHREADNPAAVPTTSDGHLITGNIGANFDRRINDFHMPYHNGLEAWLDATRPSLIVSLHSFTPKLEETGEERPWEVGLLYNNDDRAARHAIRLFEEQGISVGDNQPYSGKELNATMNRHAEAKGRAYCAIEIRNDLIATEAGQARFAAMIADISGRVLLAVEVE